MIHTDNRKNIWIIAGSRHFNNVKYMFSELNRYADMYGYPETVVSGTARGADTCGELWAGKHGIAVKKFPADWNAHGKKAGPIRNNMMAEYAKDNGMLFLFWDGQSAGSRSMLQAAQIRNIPVVQFIIDKEAS